MTQLQHRWQHELAQLPQDQALAVVRKEVTAIDHQLIRLLQQRFEAVKAIGAIKAQQAQPVRDFQREDAVLADVVGQLSDPALAAHFQAIFTTIMQESRRVQTSQREEGVK
ncbi:chorismate mutase [Lacticaseibacillus baoqingensis]|uniref:Chorismate mutase n=1 Tax=Lacticaseibacillus baoqingensis TaxID=2486013 RepID=A0ABW4E690_9LACO|nr:chorismate mutase [Lacticaseibacillus baoqingensis]